MCSLKCFFFFSFSLHLRGWWKFTIANCDIQYLAVLKWKCSIAIQNWCLNRQTRLHQGESSSVTCLTNPHQMELNCKQNCSITVHQPSLSACLSDEAIGKKAPRIGDYRQSRRGGRRGKGEWEQPEREWRERPPCSKSSCADSSASGYL